MYLETIENRAYAAYRFAQLVGILESARDTVAGGYLNKFAHLVHADLFDSIIDQADDLLKAGHIIPAAVLGRIVIETWLTDEAERQGMILSGDERAAAINDSLKKQGLFSTPKWRLVQGFLDVGNAAAHGDTAAFKSDDVAQMLQFARANCL